MFGCDIRKITERRMQRIIFAWYFKHERPEGMFYSENEDGTYTAADCSDGNIWTERFDSERLCISWLKEERKGDATSDG